MSYDFLYLASTSPRRRELLAQLGVPYRTLAIDVAELRQADETAHAYVARLSFEKARAGWAQLQAQGLPQAPVLGADTIGLLDERVLEKPRDFSDYRDMLRAMAGRTHEVITAITVMDGARELTQHCATQVRLRQLSDALIERYWLTGEPKDKAGGYGIQGMGAALVESISGNYSNVVGLPLHLVAQLCQEFSCDFWCASAPIIESSAHE